MKKLVRPFWYACLGERGSVTLYVQPKVKDKVSFLLYKLTAIVRHIQREKTSAPYRGAIQFVLHFVPWRLVSTFLYVSGVKISCRLLSTCFSSNFVLNSITVKKCEISDTFLIQILASIESLQKTTYKTFKWLTGIFKWFSSYCFSKCGK